MRGLFVTDEDSDDISIWRLLLLITWVVFFLTLIGLSIVMSWSQQASVILLVGGGIGWLLFILFLADRYTTH